MLNFFLTKIFQLVRVVNKLVQIFVIFLKNIAIWMKFHTLLEPFERTKVLRLES